MMNMWLHKTVLSKIAANVGQVFNTLTAVARARTQMLLSKFILDNLETILQEWEGFAESLLPPDRDLNQVELRDHAKKMLQEIAEDLAKPQTEKQEIAKSTGQNDS